MRSDLEQISLYTLNKMIDQESINFRPNFQRNQVWSKVKKQKLIDTILRDWYVPPIHFIEVNNKYDVLDGQQRLVAIKSFIDNKYPAKLDFEPDNYALMEMNGRYFYQLREDVKSKFLAFNLTCIYLRNFNNEAISELFYRLNDQVSLTASEKRNALYGETKFQINALVEYFRVQGLSEDIIGFSNDRMAYEDIIAKLCIYIEEDTFKAKTDNKNLSTRYRNFAFNKKTIEKAQLVFSRFYGLLKFHEFSVKFTKATLLNWLLFTYKYSSIEDSKDELFEYNTSMFIEHFENGRKALKGVDVDLVYLSTYTQFDEKVRTSLLSEFNLLCTRQNIGYRNIASRDLIIWIMFFDFISNKIENKDLSSFLTDNKIKSLYDNVFRKSGINWGWFIADYVDEWSECI